MNETKVLHTDLLERQYGPVHIVVRKHDDVLRIVDICDGNNVCRTHAVTWLTQIAYSADSVFAETAAEIKEGASLGKTFRIYGFSIEKKLIIQGCLPIPIWLKNVFQVVGSQSNYRIYEFIAVDKDGTKYSYGVVCEIDTPDFQSGPELDQDGSVADEPKLIDNYLGLLQEYLEHGEN